MSRAVFASGSYRKGCCTGINNLKRTLFLLGKIQMPDKSPIPFAKVHAAMNAMYLSGNENERALAVWMQRLGMAAQRQEGDG